MCQRADEEKRREEKRMRQQGKRKLLLMRQESSRERDELSSISSSTLNWLLMAVKSRNTASKQHPCLRCRRQRMCSVQCVCVFSLQPSSLPMTPLASKKKGLKVGRGERVEPGRRQRWWLQLKGPEWAFKIESVVDRNWL